MVSERFRFLACSQSKLTIKKGYPQAHREVNANSRAVCPLKRKQKSGGTELAGNRRLDGQFRFIPLLRQRPGRLNINV